MSLKFVTKKLEDQSLEEEKVEEMEDSGTESDDETETEQGEEGDSDNVDSGVSLNLRSGRLRLGGRRPNKQPASGGGGGSGPSHSSAKASTQLHHRPTAFQQDSISCRIDDTDNHSSEEELEDIIGNNVLKKIYTSDPDGQSHHNNSIRAPPAHNTCSNNNLNQGGGSLYGGRASAVEKRKWSQVAGSNYHHLQQQQGGGLTPLAHRTGSGSSGDEEVSGYMGPVGGPNSGTPSVTSAPYTPVQFCTSPPLHVYKPRRSQSPPPKLFHMAVDEAERGGSSGGVHSARPGHSVTQHGTPPSGAFRPKNAAGMGASTTEQLGGSAGWAAQPRNNAEGEDGAAGGARRPNSCTPDDEHRSPNKRQRSTPRPHNIQRPCLDFEKMQQIKTRVVTSWRQGTELSLFCW